MRNHLLIIIFSLLGASAISGQNNAESELVIRGDILGNPVSISISGLLPNAPTYLLPAFGNTGSNYLVSLSGDSNDVLAVDLSLANGGTYFQGNAQSNGIWNLNKRLPNSASLLDSDLYFQAFSVGGNSGNDMFQKFSNLMKMTPNRSNRWQNLENAPEPTALGASVTLKSATAGGPKNILICGGGPLLLADTSTPYPTSNKTWIYDALTETFELAPGTMQTSRAFHNAVKLKDGRVLACGGITGPFGSGNSHYTKTLNTAEIFDPNTGQWSAVAPMIEHRAGATANLLPDGRVLVAGGTPGNNANELSDIADILGTARKTTEIYDPSNDSWTAGANLPEYKAGAVSLNLSDGRIMIGGGITHTFIFGIPIPDFAEKLTIFDPATGNFGSTTQMRDKRALFAMTELVDGSVFIAGGGGGDVFNIGPIRDCEVWNPSTGRCTSTPSLSTDSAFPGCVTLPDGRALVIGGAKGSLDDPIPIADTWYYNPATNTVTPGPQMPQEHAGGSVSLTCKFDVVVIGGETGTGLATDKASSLSP